MEKVLLIDLRKPDDVVETIGFANSIKNNISNAEVSVLIYKESEHAVKCMKNINMIYTIDRIRITSIKSSPLFSDALAFNEFMSPLTKIQQSKWDYIINISNDNVSTALTSYLADKKYVGKCLNQDKSVSYSDYYWAKLHGDARSIAPNMGLSSMEILHQMLQLEKRNLEGKSYLLSLDNKIIAEKMLAIRKNQSHLSSDLKLVGILTPPPPLSEEITSDVSFEFITICLQDNEFYPILLISSAQEEKEMANRLIESLNKNLIVIEYNYNSLPYILLHLDLLITSKNDAKIIGDMTDTPMVEICPSESVPFYQSTTSEGNIIIKSIKNNTVPINPSDILKACFLLCAKENIYFEFSENITIYKVLNEQDRCEYIPIGGCLNIREELTRIIGKDIIYNYHNSEDIGLFGPLYKNIFSNDEIKSWIEQENQIISSASKVLLNCLRSINQVKLRKNKINDFIKKLDQLLEFCNNQSIASLPIALFKTDLESIPNHDYRTNIEVIEKELFALKSNLQKIFKLINSIIKHERIPLMQK